MTPETIERLARLAIIDALLEGSARYWLKRAEDFDRVGNAKCDEIARACRNKAALIRNDETPDRAEWADLLALELGDVA